MLRSRLFWRLYWGYGILILITTAVIGLLVARWLQTETLAESERLLQTQALLIRDVIGSDPENWRAPSIQAELKRLAGETETRFTVVQADGVVVADTSEDPSVMENHLMRPEIVEARRSGSGTAIRYSATLRMNMMYAAVTITDGAGQIQGYARAAYPLAIVNRRLAYLGTTVALGAVIAVAMALLVGIWVTGRFTQDIRYLGNVVGAIAKGDYTKKVRLRSSDEIGELAGMINVMAEQLAERLDTITRERNRLLAMLTGMVEGVIAIDADDRILHINEIAANLLSLDPRSSAGRKIWEATRIRAVRDTIMQARQEGRSVNQSLNLAYGSVSKTVEMYASPMLNGEGKVAGAVMLLHDVSELRRLESIRRDFAANAAHELQTPLTALRGMVETILDDKSMDAEQQRKFLNRIASQVVRLSNIVSDLLALSRAESRQEGERFRPMDIRSSIRDSVKTFLPDAEAKRIPIDASLPESPVMVAGDQEAFQQIVGNLLSNAVKYTPEGGKVWVRVGTDSSNAIIEVQDTGIGIEAKDLERIFERFYRVDKGRSREMGGTGLGLSIVRHVSRSLGGDVAAESVPGRGSTFRVTLPLAHTEEQGSPTSE